MDTGKLNNTVFYDGYEGEGEIIISIADVTEDCLFTSPDQLFRANR